MTKFREKLDSIEMSKHELSIISGVKYSTIERLYYGIKTSGRLSNPRLSTIKAIMTATGGSFDELF